MLDELEVLRAQLDKAHADIERLESDVVSLEDELDHLDHGYYAEEYIRDLER